MSPRNAPRKRHHAAVAVAAGAGLALASGALHAADKSLTGQVTSAFETVVIDATKAAAKAAAAANEALAADRKGKRRKSQKAKPDDEPEAASKAAEADKGDKAAPDPKAAGGNSAGAKPQETKPQETKPQQTKSQDAKPQEAKPGDSKPENAKAGDPKPADAKTAGPPKKDEWPAVEVELAKARCTQLLKGVDAVTIPEPPFRQGDCGAMAPVRLVSIGKSPEVSFSPPPVVSCDLVVALAKWMKDDVQPLARRHLGSEVIRLDSMSDYSCRMAYGRVGNKLSEHGKANALDIRSFVTRKGGEAVVLAHWGRTRRDIEREIAAARAAAAKAEAVKVAAEKAAKERADAAAAAAKSAATGAPLPRKTLVEGLPPKKGDAPSSTSLALPASVDKEGGFSMAPTRLGGPRDAAKARPAGAKSAGKASADKAGAGKAGKIKGTQTAQAEEGRSASDETVAALPPPDLNKPAKAPPPATPESRFLHDAHAAACRIFGTTLGPEANDAHRNHFHVDMAERKVRKICD